jgi:hypothetical protein
MGYYPFHYMERPLGTTTLLIIIALVIAAMVPFYIFTPLILAVLLAASAYLIYT